MAPIMETGEGDEYDPAHAYPDGLPEVFRWEAPAAVQRAVPAADRLALYYLSVRARAENIRTSSVQHTAYTRRRHIHCSHTCLMMLSLYLPVQQWLQLVPIQREQV